jgi:hypothetical protein
VWVGWFASGVLAHAYRYVFVDTQVQRQQTKWIVLGFAGALVGVLIASTGYIVALSTGHAGTGSLLYDDVAAAVLDLSALLIQVTVAIAILRHNLYDIDFLINRALVYTLLTAALAGLYTLGVIALGALVRAQAGQGNNSIAIVVSTLGVAAASQPLRGRIQRGIDRRFYRRRYDATRVLAEFGATLHREVDLDRLSEQLVGVVERTMEPAHVSLWLRGRAKRSDSARA